VAGCDATEVLQLAEEAFDLVALAIEGFAEARPPFAVGSPATRNRSDHIGSSVSLNQIYAAKGIPFMGSRPSWHLPSSQLKAGERN
jgi:hypothetical protein